MHWRKISGLVLLGLGLAAPAVAAERAALADAAEQRDKAQRPHAPRDGRRRERRAGRWDHRAALGRVSR